jgi:hypothetical protein
MDHGNASVVAFGMATILNGHANIARGSELTGWFAKTNKNIL